MIRGAIRTVRYAHSWKAGAAVRVQQVEVEREGLSVPATLVLPDRPRGRLPGWVAIGGVSRRGRFHPQLMRFAEALASTGAAVIVPEIPEWRKLEVSPRVIRPTIGASIDRMNDLDEVTPGRFGVIGFSFGASGVAVAASAPDIAKSVSGVVLFGGYCSLGRTLKCQLTGRHEWGGEDYMLSPDPYGRWVVASNHLTDVPGHEDATDVARALHQLAASASDRRISAWMPFHDPMIRELRASLPSDRRSVFDCFATATDAARPDEQECAALAEDLTAACRRVEPLLQPSLGEVTVPTQVIHGRGDRLMPYTEALRTMDELPGAVRRGATVTSLFNHSKDSVPASRYEHVSETAKLFDALRQLVNTV